jgi:hypothetical protein
MLMRDFCSIFKTTFSFLLLSSLASITAAEVTSPEPDPKALWQHMQDEEYQKWAYWPGTEGFYKGTHPHGALLKTYVNDVARQGLDQAPGQLPVGSIIVKENFSREKALAATTVMYKAAEGYNEEHNNWFWLKRSANGDVAAAGKVETCQSCHASSSHDYILSPLQGEQ